MRSTTATPISKGAGNSNENSNTVPVIKDDYTGKRIPIMPPGIYRGYVSEELVQRKWEDYADKTCAHIFENAELSDAEKLEVRNEILLKLYADRNLQKITIHPKRLERTTRRYAEMSINKRKIKTSQPTQTQEKSTRKRPGLLKTLACVAALTVIGTTAGVVGHELYKTYQKTGEIRPPTKNLNQIVSIFKEVTK